MFFFSPALASKLQLATHFLAVSYRYDIFILKFIRHGACSLLVTMTLEGWHFVSHLHSLVSSVVLVPIARVG
jgi:hypothetical protein